MAREDSPGGVECDGTDSTTVGGLGFGVILGLGAWIGWEDFTVSAAETGTAEGWEFERLPLLVFASAYASSMGL